AELSTGEGAASSRDYSVSSGKPATKRRAANPPSSFKCLRPSDRVVERIAVLEPAVAQAVGEPGHALLGRTVVEAFRNDVALGALLQRVITDLVGGIQRLLDVALLQQALLRGVMRPDAGEAVGLQLDTGRQAIGFHLAHALPLAVEFRQHADQVLDVVADLMRDRISLREVARRLELLRQVAEEAEVDVNLAIAGAVERPRGR